MSPHSRRKNAHKLLTDAQNWASYALENLEGIQERTAEDIVALRAAKKIVKEAGQALKALAPYERPSIFDVEDIEG